VYTSILEKKREILARALKICDDFRLGVFNRRIDVRSREPFKFEIEEYEAEVVDFHRYLKVVAGIVNARPSGMTRVNRARHYED
jgi:hypothetical protein